MKANGVAIRELRRVKLGGLRELERRTGLDRGYLSRLERGRRGASLSTLLLIAKALDVHHQAITREDP
ncbi:helix-turn-helix domain-containing protein [Streptomyces coffeae]|uniref:Helix-turn-helix transcriptional regulator n=1 Tax=Streptomyces coffeae TaxID=621382 RepID=A0ABS1NJM8_9ACTN|nr:helix-turn-helix transcriptional regulator [Streptomyces coffeae]MBL1100090.1 helix-turn-helix transcriptional regulator [Streptomyces coffeae]